MKAFRALLLVLAISASAFAGEMPFGKDGNMPNGRAGNIPYDKAGEMPFGKTGTTDLSTEIAMYLLRSVLPLF